MIIDDYAYITILRSIGGKERDEKIKLKHIKSVKIKDSFLIIRALREDVDYTEKKNKKSIGTREEDIFKIWRFDIRKIKEFEL